MINKSPIFINGFTRGGTNILMNLLLSHPDVCMPRGETHKVFRGFAAGDNLWNTLMKRIKYLPIVLFSRQDIFRSANKKVRKDIPSFLHYYIDWIFYTEKTKALHPSHNLYKSHNLKYKKSDLKAARLLCNNVNGMVLNTNNFNKIYSDSYHIGIVRNGLALCESHKRRGNSVEYFSNLFYNVCNKILNDSKQYKNYMLIKYEDIINDPINSLHNLYYFLNLDVSQLDKVRLQSKKTLQENGSHTLNYGRDREVLWYNFDEFPLHFNKDINQYQINNLSSNESHLFLKQNQSLMEELGYL